MDPGHDDALALMLALGSPGLEVLAVTTVAGNAPLEKTTNNALRLLSFLGRGDVPVGAGAKRPLSGRLVTAESIHGPSGLDGPEIPPAGFGPDPRGAVELIAKTLREARRPVTLIPTGPLTNVATLLCEHPEAKKKIARISLMGGSIGPGNTTPAAEFNVYVDPEAAKEVFGSGLPVTMCGLDVTHQARVTPERREILRRTGRAGELAADLMEFYASTYRKTYGLDAPPLHDPVAVAAVLAPELVETRRMRVDVECRGEFTRGETVCDLHGVTGREPNADVGVGLDEEGFFDLLRTAFERL